MNITINKFIYIVNLFFLFTFVFVPGLVLLRGFWILDKYIMIGL
jgi:hypothetical protein